MLLFNLCMFQVWRCWKQTSRVRVFTNLAKWNSLSFPGFPDGLSSLFGIFLAQCGMLFDASTQGNPREYLHEPYIFRNYSHWPTYLSLIVVGSKNSLSTFQIPWVFQIYKIPWDFQVFQTCKHPESMLVTQYQVYPQKSHRTCYGCSAVYKVFDFYRV